MKAKSKQLNLRVDEELATALGEVQRLEDAQRPPSLSETVRRAIFARLLQLRKAAERRK